MNSSPTAAVAVLDDDDDVASSLAGLLTAHGLPAVAYQSVNGLSAAIAQREFAAFVLDWFLGDTTASDLIVRLRSDLRLARAPIFLLSGNLAVGGVPQDPELIAAIRRHRLHFRAKPYSPARLAQDLVLELTKTRINVLVPEAPDALAQRGSGVRARSTYRT